LLSLDHRQLTEPRPSLGGYLRSMQYPNGAWFVFWKTSPKPYPRVPNVLPRPQESPGWCSSGFVPIAGAELLLWCNVDFNPKCVVRGRTWP
jgi:hypothetical protein